MSSYSKSKLKTSYYHRESTQPMLRKTFHELQDKNARCFPDRDAFVFCESGVRISVKQFVDETNQLACDLVKLGLKPGERVCLWMGDGYEWMLLNSAAIRAGLITIELAELQSADRLRHIINKTECSVLFVGFSQYDQYKKLIQVTPDIKSATSTLSYVPSLRNIVTFDDDCPLLGCSIVMHAKQLQGRCGAEEDEFIQTLKNKVSVDDPYIITFISGSTGYPKPVVRTQRANIANLYASKRNAAANDGSIIKVLKLAGLGSYCHIYQTMLLTWGATLVWPRPTEDFSGALEAVEQEQCNFVVLFPQFLSQAVNQQNITSFDLSSLKRCWCTGNVFSEGNILNAIKLLCPNTVVMYGSNQVQDISIGDIMDTVENRIRVKTQVIHNCEVKITDTHRNIVPVNTRGEIWVRGPYLFQCYYGDRERTEKVKDACGWYYTGDLGQMEEDGRLVILGRKDDMIIKGTLNVYPAEITNHLGNHPKLKDAHVVPVPGEKLVNEICLCLVLKEKSTCTMDEMLEFLAGKVSPLRNPRYFLFFTNIPTMGLKVNRKAIIKEAVERLGLS
ncbi:medium-chain acyl-CoA ligase ACSF2, mitochondrial-like [Saccoglossus kowalevskii]|uniref:Acyl-CoA synthetase family member 2, mitochondrial-like n=1 Tax=Saccoglossus kowalevskii TaxID=10224 RepID=A0ABM0MDY0_SACKO|nr:PREDICTED: acyl-CoA synthetase family member 2, mitochondrial-like [Saccoglossus kowalevskii]